MWFFRVSLFLAALALVSCSDRIVVPVDGIPADSTITEVELENYVNRVYIALLNRKPGETEAADALAQLSIDPYNRVIRDAFVEAVQADPTTKWVTWQSLSNDFLEGVDTTELGQRAQFFQAQYDQATQSDVREFWLSFLQRNQAHGAAYQGWVAGDTSINALIKRMILLPEYDEINAGVENFVVTLYQHFYYRYPTDSELARASEMHNHFWSTLYGINGHTKEEFVDIFFGTSEWQQGLVMRLFISQLGREPQTSEVVKYLGLIQSGWNYDRLKRYLLSSSEYVNQ